MTTIRPGATTSAVLAAENTRRTFEERKTGRGLVPSAGRRFSDSLLPFHLRKDVLVRANNTTNQTTMKCWVLVAVQRNTPRARRVCMRLLSWIIAVLMVTIATAWLTLTAVMWTLRFEFEIQCRCDYMFMCQTPHVKCQEYESRAGLELYVRGSAANGSVACPPPQLRERRHG